MLFRKGRWRKKMDRLRRQKRYKKHVTLWKNQERKHSLKHLSDKGSPAFVWILSGKASLCASWKGVLGRLKKASLTVETALVLPLFFFGMVTMISFMDIYKIQTEHLSSLCQKAKEAGMYAYLSDGGAAEITLPDAYSYTPVSGVIPLPAVRMYNVVKVHTWTGAEHKDSGSEADEIEPMVYVTESGTVYHKSLSCSYLNLSVTQVAGSSISSYRNGAGEKYHACEKCSRNQQPAGTVYVTKSGNRYHNDASCSGLKRSVRLVKESEAGERHACSRCG